MAIKTTGVYHTSIPADDLERATKFYSEVLGMDVMAAGANEGGVPLSRLKCGSETVVLFKRPKPANRDSFKEDGVYHQAFHIAIEDYETAVTYLKDKGLYRDAVDRPSGKTVYFVDSEGNFEELHAP